VGFRLDAKELQTHQRIADDVLDRSHRRLESPQSLGLAASLKQLLLQRFPVGDVEVDAQ